MGLTLQPVRVANSAADEDGLLVLVEDRLVAVLVRLSDANEVAPGEWFLEAGFGRLHSPDHPTFTDLETAEAWIGANAAGPGRATGAVRAAD